MLEGICPKCGVHLFGWVLRNPQHQICPDCGVPLIITDGKGMIYEEKNPDVVDKYYKRPGKNDNNPDRNDRRTR
jgi:hypothetical protein